MSVPNLQKQRVHDAVMTAVRDCRFVRVAFAPKGGGGFEMQTGDENDAVVPGSIVLDEINASFSEARRNRRTMLTEKSDWRFHLHIGFSCPVSLEALERKFTERGGLVIPSDSANGLRQIRVKLLDMPTFHPPQGQPGNGTLVRLTLSAEVGPS